MGSNSYTSKLALTQRVTCMTSIKLPNIIWLLICRGVLASVASGMTPTMCGKVEAAALLNRRLLRSY